LSKVIITLSPDTFIRALAPGKPSVADGFPQARGPLFSRLKLFF